MRKERDITIKVIRSDIVGKRRLAQFFAKKFIEERKDKSK